MKSLMVAKQLLQTISPSDQLPKPLKENLIGTIWSMIYGMAEIEGVKSGLEKNPLIPRLLEHLASYQRKSKITKNEIL